MIKLKETTRLKSMHYLFEADKNAEYDMNCYKEGTVEHEKEKERYESLNALYLSMQNIAEEKEL